MNAKQCLMRPHKYADQPMLIVWRKSLNLLATSNPKNLLNFGETNVQVTWGRSNYYPSTEKNSNVPSRNLVGYKSSYLRRNCKFKGRRLTLNGVIDRYNINIVNLTLRHSGHWEWTRRFGVRWQIQPEHTSAFFEAGFWYNEKRKAIKASCTITHDIHGFSLN